MKILVLGHKGQLGRCIEDQLTNTNHRVTYFSKKNIDISNFEEMNIKIADISPEIVINAAAYTNVDLAEKNKRKANIINGEAVANIAEICKSIDALLVHISTDYVFDGNSNQPINENARPNPQTVYGKSKLNGELAIKKTNCKYIIIRTAWVFSEYGNNFLKTMLSLGKSKKELFIIDDQIGCPTYAQDLANAIVNILPYFKSASTCQKVYHYCGDKPCSWYDFANVIFEYAKKKSFLTPEIIKPIKSNQYQTLATRPLYSVLDCSNFQKTFNQKTSNYQ